MSPATARRLEELRATMDATFTVEQDNGTAILVRVEPFDLPAFSMVIDPALWLPDLPTVH